MCISTFDTLIFWKQSYSTTRVLGFLNFWHWFWAKLIYMPFNCCRFLCLADGPYVFHEILQYCFAFFFFWLFWEYNILFLYMSNLCQYLTWIRSVVIQSAFHVLNCFIKHGIKRDPLHSANWLIANLDIFLMLFKHYSVINV